MGLLPYRGLTLTAKGLLDPESILCFANLLLARLATVVHENHDEDADLLDRIEEVQSVTNPVWTRVERLYAKCHGWSISLMLDFSLSFAGCSPAGSQSLSLALWINLLSGR